MSCRALQTQHHRLDGVAPTGVNGLRGLAATRDLPPRAVVLTVLRAAALEEPIGGGYRKPLPASFVAPAY